MRFARLAEVIAELREAQRLAAQAAAARRAAEHLRAAMPGYVTPPPGGRTTSAERSRAEFPFPPGTFRHRTGSPGKADDQQGARPVPIAPTESDAVTGLGGSAEVEGSALHGRSESPPCRGSEHELRPPRVLRVADSAAVVRQGGDLRCSSWPCMVCALPMQRVSTPSSMTAHRDGGLEPSKIACRSMRALTSWSSSSSLPADLHALNSARA